MAECYDNKRTEQALYVLSNRHLKFYENSYLQQRPALDGWSTASRPELWWVHFLDPTQPNPPITRKKTVPNSNRSHAKSSVCNKQ